jgi:hypothetical protein
MWNVETIAPAPGTRDGPQVCFDLNRTLQEPRFKLKSQWREKM